MSLGVNFINVLCAAFACTEPKSIKKDSQVVSLFMLLGSAHTKAALKYVGEIDPYRVTTTLGEEINS